MKYSAQEIANILGGTIEGDSTVSVSYVAKIEEVYKIMNGGCYGRLHTLCI